MTRWFRVYDEILDDHKVQALSPDLFKTWVNLLAVASRNKGRLPAVSVLAFALRVSVQDMQLRLDDLILCGLIDICSDKSLEPHNWSRRQWASDDSAERVKRHREKKKTSETKDEIGCNGDVTVTVTAPYSTDTDTDTESVTPLPPEPDPKGSEHFFKSNLKGESEGGSPSREPYPSATAKDCSAASEVRELTLKRAEGLGLDVADILGTARRSGPRNLDAYFQALCRKQLRERLPHLNDEVLRQAFSRNSSAFATVCQLMTMAEV